MTAYFNFPQKNASDLDRPPCASKHASASTFSTNDWIFITFILNFLIYIVKCMKFFMSQIVFI